MRVQGRDWVKGLGLGAFVWQVSCIFAVPARKPLGALPQRSRRRAGLTGQALLPEQPLVVGYGAPGWEVVRLTDAVQQRLLLGRQRRLTRRQHAAKKGGGRKGLMYGV